jgi:RNA recognition motif-containing protein
MQMYGMPFLPPMLGMKPQRRPKAPPPTQPQATLYIRNLNEKLKVIVIKEALLTIFSQFGKVVDIKYKRNLQHRGQAFVSFESIEIATEAMQKSQGFPLFDKPMDIQYARDPSFAVSLLDGEEKLNDHKRRRQEGTKQPVKRTKGSDDHQVPNAILFVQNLPEGTTEQALVALFSPFPGFKEVRLVPGKMDIAFVEYETDGDSMQAKQSLHGFRMTADTEIKVTFAK